MLQYVLKRLFSGVLTIWFIATATFFAMHAVPGDPLMNEKAVSPQIRAQLEARYGLDKPLPVQYVIFLKNMVQGDFGVSFVQQNREVNDIIREHFPVSASLGVLALFIALVGALLWGSLTATYRDKWQDHTITVFVIAAISVPGFVFAALAQWGVVQLNQA